ncbi:MAG: hypothetical protein A2Z83_03710 [Omnitrophica bacterium GWA2_52_8]|nr:MAG: hypothetical protein A2Z83_03710 [Omnitrophica bacterium GWA2_52_8]
MAKKKLPSVSFVVFGAFLISGCASLNPFIEDLNIISVPQERALSSEMSRSLKTEMKIVGDVTAVNRVNTIGNRLVGALPRKNFDYRFAVVDDPTPNAFTIAGGAIYVHTGLLKMTSDEELAGVLAHEIGHAYERHPTKGITRAYGAKFLETLVLNPNEQNKVKTLALQMVQQSVLNKYTRSDEREADEIAFYLLKRANMPAGGLLSFFQKLQSLQGKQPAFLAFLNTHPPTSERIAHIEELMRSETPSTVLN